MNEKIRILLVDDEEQFVKNMARILKVRGFAVSTAFSGYDAVDAVKSESAFDVVLLDIKMPGLDGIETLREIKTCAPHTEVIMLTGHATAESAVEGLKSGAADYLMKPTHIDELIQKAQEAYEKRQRLEEKIRVLQMRTLSGSPRHIIRESEES